MATMDPIGERLRKAREERGLTMLQLGQACGVDQGTISLLERGKMPNASFRVLSRVARSLGISMDELATLEVREAVPA